MRVSPYLFIFFFTSSLHILSFFPFFAGTAFFFSKASSSGFAFLEPTSALSLDQSAHYHSQLQFPPLIAPEPPSPIPGSSNFMPIPLMLGSSSSYSGLSNPSLQLPLFQAPPSISGGNLNPPLPNDVTANMALNAGVQYNYGAASGTARTNYNAMPEPVTLPAPLPASVPPSASNEQRKKAIQQVY